MKISELAVEDLNNDLVDKIVYENIEDTGEQADIILVLGSRFANKYRVPKAVELYKKGRSNKMVITGGGVIPELDNISEASFMKLKAIELGVPESDIIIEQDSRTTVENMICSMLLLERELKLSNIKRILLVTTRFHMKRSLLLSRAYFPKWIEIIPCPADDMNTLRNNWYLTDEGIKRAKAEAVKIISLVKEGCVLDFEI